MDHPHLFHKTDSMLVNIQQLQYAHTARNPATMPTFALHQGGNLLVTLSKRPVPPNALRGLKSELKLAGTVPPLETIEGAAQQMPLQTRQTSQLTALLTHHLHPHHLHPANW